jgi:hypothetical protein
LLFHLLLFHLSIIVAPIYYCFTHLLLFHPLRGLGLIPVVFVFTPSLLKGEEEE